MNALFDTSLLLDYLRGVAPADAALERFQHRAITVMTWAEVMTAAPVALIEQTRDFLLTFERLPIDAAICERALTLIRRYSRLRLRHTLPWATAQMSSLIYVTSDFPAFGLRDETLFVPYRLPKARKRPP